MESLGLAVGAARWGVALDGWGGCRWSGLGQGLDGPLRAAVASGDPASHVSCPLAPGSVQEPE
ncbi:hypothetical protein [uncultured Thiocystis sp.]|uniref:hypothetical protein n=1 Tax=uncultured Thiocystis sp. TaxID=1202134 RepID=UPI0025EFBAB8|nr:hypothetical protein [uncultured Thiocystis sp.]